MGKVKFGIAGAAEAEANSGDVGYKGPLPPKGAYKGIVKRLELVTNKSGNPMLKYLLELKATKGSENAKYDGYGIWGNLNVTDQGKGWVNGFLDALTDGSDAKIRYIRKAFWEGGLITEGKDDVGHVVRIGNVKVGSPKANLPVAFTIKEDTYGGNLKMIVNKFLLSAAAEEEEDEYVEDGDIDAEEVEEVEGEDDDMF